ncbi:MAG: DUF924 family protein, partial [Caulobacter sp.]|nr:DUF924 family protein [Caulobacter sp.]
MGNVAGYRAAFIDASEYLRKNSGKPQDKPKRRWWQSSSDDKGSADSSGDAGGKRDLKLDTLAGAINGGEAFDRQCETRFLDAHLLAARRGCEDWLASAEGALALLVLLDQIPRNIFRGSGHAFASDGLARHYAHRALAAGHDAATGPSLRAFFYLPFEHSEDMADQQRAVELFGAPGMEEYLPYA